MEEEWVNLIQMAIIPNTVDKNPLEEMESPSLSKSNGMGD